MYQQKQPSRLAEWSLKLENMHKWIVEIYHWFSSKHTTFLSLIQNFQMTYTHTWLSLILKNSILLLKTTRVFPKWISLNSANSENHDKIQKWYGYQSY